jgi:hypothetical protein
MLKKGLNLSQKSGPTLSLWTQISADFWLKFWFLGPTLNLLT